MSDWSVAAVGVAVPQTGTAPAQGSAAPEEASVQSRPTGSQTEREDKSKTLAEMMQEAREKAEKRRDSLKLRKNASQYGDAAMTAYARLARARNAGEVDAAAGYARRRISQFQAAVRSDEDNAERIKAAIRQLQKAVGRAGRKKRELRQEDLTRARQRKAQMEKQRRKAAHLGQQLNRSKTMRMIRESGYLREAEIDNRLQAQLAQTRLELREQAQKLAETVGPSLEAAAQSYAAGSVAAPPPAASVDVQA